MLSDALLSGVGIVRAPSYEDSVVEARGRRGSTLRARIPSNKRVACSCSGASCKFARLMREGVKKAFDDAFKQHARTVAAYGEYNRPLGSVSRGTLRGKVRPDGDAEVEIDVPTGESGDALLRAIEDSGVVVRPLIEDLDDVPSFEGRAEHDEVRIYHNFRIRAIIVSATDMSEGWDEPELIPTPDLPPQPQRRARVWL